MRVILFTLLLLLWAAPSRAEQELAVYPGTVHTRIGNDLLIGGQYHRMAYFTTPDPMVKVAKYFTDLWRKQGYPVVASGDFKQEGVVSAFYTREGLQRAVVLRTHMGKTVGFTVLKDLWLYETPPDAGKGHFIQVEGALFSADVGTRDEAGGSRHRTQVVERGLDTVRQELASKFTAAGYKPVRDSGGTLDRQRTLVLEYARGAEQTITTLVELEPSRVAISQTWVGTDRPDGMPNADAVHQARQEAIRTGLVKEKQP
ncbi:hypothetical protein [Archangium violaceum]|uniref:hypothetical protein n=1 Tax=Archangium violaceum TaxID=83451 RepID=UPI001EF5F548|nr:hypothetical protein [Archangium violaceum]